MYDITYNSLDGTIKINDTYSLDSVPPASDATPYFNAVGDEYVLSFINLQNVSKIVSFTYSAINTTDSRYLTTYYRISRDSNA